jgi:phenylpropionate dioxygenase-like ring-hydroxylating dioxygenase large terminal subunit
MLTKDENEILCRTGPGTPMGNLFRRFWLPALLSAELPDPDGIPVRLRILGEDLVAFRNTDGTVGIIEAYCSHRRAPLFFGRNEHCGLRCPYHGWKFDTNGQCLETPNLSAHLPDIRRNVSLKAYPIHEVAGLVWIYMGPAEHQPAFPAFEYARVAPGHFFTARWLQRSNWSQGMEGEVDSSHISWLHRDFDQENSVQNNFGSRKGNDRAPLLELRETPYGFACGARRAFQDQWFWRVTQWMAPMFSLIPHEPGEFVKCGGRAWVPIDDNHVTVFTFAYRIDRPWLESELDIYRSGAVFPPRMNRGPYTLADGYVIDTYLPLAAKENDYLMDRDMQKNVNYSGIWGVHDQDRALAENSKPTDRRDPGILDRTQEHLVSSDRAIVMARRRLLRMAADLSKGIAPPALTQPELFSARAIAKISPLADFDQLLAAHADEARFPAAAGAGARVSHTESSPRDT